MERRLIPVNAVLDLVIDDGLNPAPLAAAGWSVAALEVPVIGEAGTTVCDVVLFNAPPRTVIIQEMTPRDRTSHGTDAQRRQR